MFCSTYKEVTHQEEEFVYYIVTNRRLIILW
nr:MAG TPA: hypothetical protein [Bacteriophage sp.]